jgi:hypothetical protein
MVIWDATEYHLNEGYHYRETHSPRLYVRDRCDMFLHNTGNTYIIETKMKIALNWDIFACTVLQPASNNSVYSQLYLDRTMIYILKEFWKQIMKLQCFQQNSRKK